jgi:hypothetical protein
MTQDVTMQTSGRYVDYRGERYPMVFAGADWVAVPAAPEDQGSDRFPDAIEHGDNSRGTWVKLPKESLDRRVDVRVDARWRGEAVTVAADLGDEVVLHWSGTPDRALELGMQGDQRDGWQRRVPVAEVEVVDVTERVYG